MQRPVRPALPEGVPPEGMRVIRAESEEDLEHRFADAAREGYVPAQNISVHAHYDEGEGAWKTLYVLPLWRVGQFGEGGGSEEMFG